MESGDEAPARWGVAYWWRRASILSGLYELDPAPRRFLLFIVFNVVSWQCIIGPAMILYAHKIAMPPSWIGFLISFTPMSTLLVVTTGLLVTRFGAKRVMYVSWTLRNIIACLVFMTPWAMAHWGAQWGGYVLTGTTFGFCFMRAIGVGGWFPWLHEVVPERQRGAYFSSEAAISQLLCVAVAAFQAWILRGDPGVGRFIAIYAVGIASGFISTLWMHRIPGGQAASTCATLRSDMAIYRRTLADRPFVTFVVTVALCYSATSWLGSAAVLYLRDALGFSSRTIMIVTAVCSISVMVTIRHWARFAERNGSAYAMHLLLAGHAIAAAAFLLLWPGSAWNTWLMAPFMAIATVFGAAFGMTANRAMLSLVKAPDRVGYTNVWMVGTSLTLGVTPILVGQIIDHGGLWGFRICFIVASLSALACAHACLFAVKEPARPAAARRPIPFLFRPIGAISRIIRVTLGREERARA